MSNKISICWFRQDLRLTDNPALLEASKIGAVLPIYIKDDLAASPFKMGAASKVYLQSSLDRLNHSLNNTLNLYIGNPKDILFKLATKYNIENIFWNRCYEPWYISEDQVIQEKLRALKINCVIANGSYLWEPNRVKKEDGSYYKVFTPYKRKAYSISPREPLKKPTNLVCIKDEVNPTQLHDLKLTPTHYWATTIKESYTFGENAAQEKLQDFIHNKLSGYKNSRDYPGRAHTSRLSEHLHFGEISPNQVWHATHSIAKLYASDDDIHHFLSEIVWREFSCYLMSHFPELPHDNFQNKFNRFPWRDNEILLNAWKKGQTGYPIVDAGMRELWQTGYMHNRVRMIVASFLVKNLMLHWHHGRDWFWDCLMDADLGSNSFNWQWVAGCGADAAPYFRIFNPTTQGEKFDSDGSYTKRFVPELKNLPKKYLFEPWKAPATILKDAGIILGVDYPNPIVDLKNSRDAALLAYKSL